MEFFAVNCKGTNVQLFVQDQNVTEILILQGIPQGYLLAVYTVRVHFIIFY